MNINYTHYNLESLYNLNNFLIYIYKNHKSFFAEINLFILFN